MAKFSFGEHLTNSQNIVSAKLGATAAEYTDTDVGYPVKLSADSRFVKCVSGDSVDGFITSIESYTVETYSFGGVQMGGFKSVTVTGPIAVGDYVKAGTGGKLIKHTFVADASANPKALWRYVSGEVNAGAVDCKGTILKV